MKSSWLAFVVAALLLTVSPEADAQWVATNLPAQGVFEVTDANGNTLTYDANRRIATLENSAGARHLVSFAKLAAYHSTDPAWQAEFIGKLVDEIMDANNRVAFTSETVPTLNLGSPGSPGGPGNPGGNGEMFGLAGTGKRLAEPGQPSLQDGGGSGPCPAPPHSCDCFLDSCSPYRDERGRFFYAWDQHSPSWSLSGETQMCRALHRESWDRQRMDQCEGMAYGSAVTGFGAILTGATCAAAFASGGVAAVACAATGAVTAAEALRTYRAFRRCSESYPGPPLACG